MRKLLSKEEVKEIIRNKPSDVKVSELVASLMEKEYSLDGFEVVVVDNKTIIKEGPSGKDGKNGITPRKGVDYFDGKDGRDGRDGRDGPKGDKGEPGDIKDLSPQEIRDLLELLSDEDRLDAKYIKNLPQPITQVIQQGGHVGAYETPIVAGSNITVTKNAFGNWVIASTAQGGVGTPTSPSSGTVDGSTVAFDFTTKPTLIVSDGATYRENFGWTWSGSTATLSVPPVYDLFAL